MQEPDDIFVLKAERERGDKSGADVDAVLAAVEQEYGASPEDD